MSAQLFFKFNMKIIYELLFFYKINKYSIHKGRGKKYNFGTYSIKFIDFSLKFLNLYLHFKINLIYQTLIFFVYVKIIFFQHR